MADTRLITQEFLKKSLENISAAQNAYNSNQNNACANRAYYASFQAAIAALADEGITHPHIPHSWVQAEFNGTLIKRRKRYKLKKRFYLIIIMLVLMVISNFIVRNTSVSSISIFDTTSLFTYFGVLIGFGLTIYTFGLSMLWDIKSKVDENVNYTVERKNKIHDSLERGFNEIKEDLWWIFYSMVSVILIAFTKGILDIFDCKLAHWKIPETFNLLLFITTTIAMWDIIKTLFNVSEINLLLLNKKTPQE